MNNQVIKLINRKNEAMYGIFTSPDKEPGDKKLVIFCHPGTINKSGTSDALKIVSDKLSEEGYYVLRFDQTATGESEGEWDSCTIQGFYRKVQDGAYVNDTADVIEAISDKYPGYKIYMLGYCGGCISITLACKMLPEKVEGLIYLAIPILYTKMTDEDTIVLRDFRASILMKQYFSKLLQPRYYWRLITFESDWKLITNVLGRNIDKILRRMGIIKKNVLHPLFNYELFNGYEEVVKQGKKILFLMAELDNETVDFNNEFKSKILNKRPELMRSCKIKYLEKTDHAIMFEQSRKQLISILLEWLSVN